jgi:beta-lactamase regulating signal transducer with metallopeptidase domain
MNINLKNMPEFAIKEVHRMLQTNSTTNSTATPSTSTDSNTFNIIDNKALWLGILGALLLLVIVLSVMACWCYRRKNRNRPRFMHQHEKHVIEHRGKKLYQKDYSNMSEMTREPQ